MDERLARLDEAGWQKKGAFLMDGGKWEESVANSVWLLLFDAVRHHGRLSVYLRPMGCKVPSIYGPSTASTGQ